MTQETTVPLSKIFLVFAKTGAFTLGGGYVMIPALQAEMSRRGWISDDELPDIVALAQSAPGLLAVNMSIFAGYRLRGFKGSVIATLGSVLPSFAIILLIAMVFAGFKDNPYIIKVFAGIRPVAVALIAAAAIKMGRKNVKTWWAWAICIGSALGVALLKISAIYILLVLIVAAAAFSMIREGRRC